MLKKDPVQLSFALAGVRTPLRAQQASAGRPATQDEPFCHEALALTRRLVLQREVELDVRRAPTCLPSPAPRTCLRGTTVRAAIVLTRRVVLQREIAMDVGSPHPCVPAGLPCVCVRTCRISVHVFADTFDLQPDSAEPWACFALEQSSAEGCF